jgi:polyribonucleotide nucleotidyltransferase
MARIKAIVAEPEVGEVYHGTVKSIVEFGAFIEILPGKEGLLHVSEIDWKRVENVSDVLNEGDEIDVKLIDIDKKNNKLKLSRRALLPKPEGYVERPARPERSNNDRGPRNNDRGDRGGYRGNDRGDRNDRGGNYLGNYMGGNGYNDRGDRGGFNDRRNNGGYRGNRRGSDDAQG